MLLIGRIKPGELVSDYIRFQVASLRRPIAAGHICCTTYGVLHKVAEGYWYYGGGGSFRLLVHGNGIIFKGPYAIAKPHVEDWVESRLDIIGQNGNDGLHYPTS